MTTKIKKRYLNHEIEVLEENKTHALILFSDGTKFCVNKFALK